MSNDRDKALDMALSQIDKQFGKGSIMRMGEKGTMAIEAVSTGALSLDLAFMTGVVPLLVVTALAAVMAGLLARLPGPERRGVAWGNDGVDARGAEEGRSGVRCQKTKMVKKAESRKKARCGASLQSLLSKS